MKALLIFAALAAGLLFVGVFINPVLAAIAGPILGWIFVGEMRKAQKI